MNMYCQNNLFWFDEIIEIGYCPVCDKSLYLRPHTQVKKRDNCVGDIESMFVRYTTHCDVCGHHICATVPCDVHALPMDTKVIHVGRLMEQ